MSLKVVVGVIIAIAVVGTLGLIFAINETYSDYNTTPYSIPPLVFEDSDIVSLNDSQKVGKFDSYDQIRKFLQERQMLDFDARHSYYFSNVDEQREASRGQVFPDAWTGSQELAVPQSAKMPRPEPPAPLMEPIEPSHSTTNVQVVNVDEPDYLKNDDKYAYIVYDDKLTIVEVYPAETAETVLKVGLDLPPGHSLQNIFLNKDRLVIFYEGYQEIDYIPEYGFAPTKMRTDMTHAILMDVSDKENPEIVKDYSINGHFSSARMIGDNVYLVTTSNVDYNRPLVPQVRQSSGVVATPDVFYFDNPERHYDFNTITAIDVFEEKIAAETYLMSGAGTIYVSEDNIYITYQKNLPYQYYQTIERDRFFDAILPALPRDVQERIRQITNDDTIPNQQKWSEVSDILQEAYNRLSSSERADLFERIRDSIDKYDSKIHQETERTVVHKIRIDDMSLNYVSMGEVPGRLLNQFSMDEHQDRFRVATTSEFYEGRSRVEANNVYVLDENLKTVGKLEKIAEDESIYSARFMGERLYLVTFERIDPFFVIDLSSDTPKVLGELKIPGYSNYLHPYDANHIIGIGKDTKENEHGRVEVLGVKVSLFDVTNVNKPAELDVETIGESGTESEVLRDHKALLFDKNRNILSIPIRMQGERILNSDIDRYENRYWQGFYVFGVSPDDGFTLRAKISHYNGTGYDHHMPSRSFYIGDVLYTVSSNLIKMNDISDMEPINQLRLHDQPMVIKYLE